MLGMSDDSKKLHAAEAYNRFMEKRVRLLEHQLEEANTKVASLESGAGGSGRTPGRGRTEEGLLASTYGGGSPSGADGMPLTFEQQLSNAGTANTLVTENIKLQTKVREMKAEVLNYQRERSLFKANVENANKKLKFEKDRGNALESELADLKALLPTNLFNSDGAESMFGGIAPSTFSGGGGGMLNVTSVNNNMSMTTRTNNNLSMTMSGTVTAGGPLESTLKEVAQEYDRDLSTFGRQVTTPVIGVTSPEPAGSGPNSMCGDADDLERDLGDLANGEGLEIVAAPYDATRSMVALFEPTPGQPLDLPGMYERRVETLRLALSFAKDDSTLDDPSLSPELAASQPKTQVERALMLFKQSDASLTTAMAELQKAVPAVTEAHTNRRSMLNFLVESQAQRGKVPAANKVRGTNLQTNIASTRSKLDAVYNDVVTQVPECVQAILSCVSATIGLYLYHRRNVDVALCLAALEETLGVWLVLPTKLKSILELPRGMLEERFEATMAKVQRDGTWERLDLPQLKEMSVSLAERGSQGAEAHVAMKEINEHARRTKKLLETLWRVVRGENVNLRALTNPDGGNQADEDEAEDKAPKIQHRSTQVNFTFREVTELDMKLKALASIRQPWFECVKEVTPQVRSVSLSPSITKRRVRNVGGEQHGEVYAQSEEDAPKITTHRRRETARIWDEEKDETELVDRLLAEYKLRGLALPHNFARIKKDGNPNAFLFGTRTICLRPGGNSTVLAVQVGGGWLQLDEFVGKHLRSETAKLKAVEERIAYENRPAAGIVLPEVPYRKTHGSLARKLMYNLKPTMSMVGKPSMRNPRARITGDTWDSEGESPVPTRPSMGGKKVRIAAPFHDEQDILSDELLNAPIPNVEETEDY